MQKVATFDKKGMPACKNDPTKKYKGDEPSPKGLGHCAHAEKVGTTKKGLDGRKWTVQTNKNGTKSWKPRPKTSGAGPHQERTGRVLGER